jgi:hypothetical protein
MAMKWSAFSPVLWIRKALEKLEGGGPLEKAVHATIREFPDMDRLGDCLFEWVQDPQVVGELMRSLEGNAEANLELLTESLLAHNFCGTVNAAGDARTVVIAFLDALRFKILDAQLMVLGQP